jgi:hypothetical protein
MTFPEPPRPSRPDPGYILILLVLLAAVTVALLVL